MDAIDVPTSFQLFGYAGLAILLFSRRGRGGVALAVTILVSDIRANRKLRRTTP